MKISQIWKLMSQDMRIDNYSPKTLESYQIQFNVTVRHLGDFEIEDVDLVKIKDYLAIVAEEVKVSTLQHRIKFLRRLFKYAHDEGYLSINYAQKLKMPKEGVRVPKTISEESIEAMRIDVKTSLEALLIELFYSTGCRINEISRANKSDVDLEDRSIKIRGKGDKERIVYFSKRTQVLLRRYYAERKDDTEYLIASRNKIHGEYRRMSTDSLRLIVKKIAKQAGVDENIYPHKFRHSFATHLVNRGAPIEAVQQFLGHARSETTMIYVYHSRELKKKLYEQYF